MGLIRKFYTYLDTNSFHYLFTALVRTYLEYCVSTWHQPLRKDEELIEKVLCPASKLIHKILNLSYADHLHAIDISSMKCGKIRGDMIQVYNFHGEDESLKALFDINSTSITGGHKFKIKRPFVKNKIHKHFFSIWVTNDWNSLPSGVSTAVSLYSFRRKLDKIWSDKK